ncbi:DMT family transporter [Streptoalloteichus tenebrarius]|uniref:DMT family transporter n=1 Tax=Streptoalloteichus tenebrarius (strain ATCC 17920 / DSM 40477 / JCM 4838 / CBS 697.72 / NBRC 16177 / NCIMB 11028 / NRRL B-12390 / A12253. 1 / ISP 5477) TaxID=1933 RepID=UPI0020A5D157|nr:EamA family transporter [Streptoalloteichus tenebrarius]
MLGKRVTTADRTWLVACSAALWGTDGLLRKPLADALPAATVVFWEHVIVLVLLLPWLPGALRALRRCSAREWLAVLAIGAGSSAAATALFTAAFRVGDAVTPLVLQKLQPVFVVLAASALLRERVRAGYLVFAVPALVGAWLLTFPNPFQVRVAAAQAALLAVGAAALWAAGTVLGRLVSRSLSPREVTVSRFATGLPAAAVVVWLQDAPVAVGWGNATGLVLLAVVPGLLALSLYYLGLRSTPASRATLAELAFPATAALIGVGLLGNHLTATQWLGFALVVAMVTALGWHERVRRVPVVQDRTGREEMVPG